MTGPAFIDTNILVYAFADTGDEKHSKAQSLTGELLDAQDATVSVQVLKEFYTVATRKVKKPLSHREAAAVVKDLSLACRVVDDTLPQLDRALELVDAYSLSIWDASIAAAAEAAGCHVLYTEDLADGSAIGAVHVRNPLLNRDAAGR